MTACAARRRVPALAPWPARYRAASAAATRDAARCFNEPLSRDRALAVRDYFSSRGVLNERVVVQGRGSREPVASNDSDVGRAANRQVEIFLSDSAS